jgi:DNA-binding beta-propeller fold protein YncE
LLILGFLAVLEEAEMKTLAIVVVVGAIACTGLWAQETPSPALLVLHKGENAMAIVDPENGRIAGHIPTGQDPHELAVSADGKLAFASNYSGSSAQGGNSISVIDIAARQELHRVDIAPLGRPHGLWFADGKLYFTAEANMAIGRYDPSTNKVDWVLGTGQGRTHMVLVGKDQKIIITSNVDSDTISIFERAQRPPGPPGGPGGPPLGAPPPGGPGGPPRGPGGPPAGPVWKQTLISVSRGPEGFDLSPDAKEIWTAHMRDGGISIIDVASKKVIHTIDARARGPNRLKFTPDGKLALVSEIGGGGLIVLDTGSRRVIKQIPLGRGTSGILIPPGGTRAYVALTGDNAVAIVDLAALSEVGRLKTGRGPDGMAWLATKQ